MTDPGAENGTQFRYAVEGLLRGDFSLLEPRFDGDPCRIVEWFEAGLFATEPAALAEAFSCACFLGRTRVAEFLLDRGVDPAAGVGSGLSAFHWAANRGNLETVKLLIARKAPLEQRNVYGGTVLGATVWAAVHEPRGEQIAVLEALLGAGANLEEAGYPSGNERVDEALSRWRRKI